MKSITLGMLVVVLTACGNKETEVKDDSMSLELKEECQDVEVELAQVTPFAAYVVSNGKIAADRYVDLYWQTSGMVAEVNVMNGQAVRKGDVIARMDDFRLRNAAKSSKAHLEQTRLSMYDFLIGQGYSVENMDAIPSATLELAKVKSGYTQAEAQYEMAQFELQNSQVVAPFAGVVANLKQNAGSRTINEPICRVISQEQMDVEFSIIESELAVVRKGNSIKLEAYSIPEKHWEGSVEAVNPVIENNGMMQVKARVKNGSGLLDGMNVQVTVKNTLGEMLSVPKTAVVLRSGRKVVFVAKNGRADWRYVKTSVENADRVVVTEGVAQGDSVIISGNMNLAHNSNITIKQ